MHLHYSDLKNQGRPDLRLTCTNLSIPSFVINAFCLNNNDERKSAVRCKKS